MGKLRFDLSVSLDGFVAGPNPSLEDPLGVGGEKLHDWAVATAAFRERHGGAGGETGVDSDVLAEIARSTGATVWRPHRRDPRSLPRAEAGRMTDAGRPSAPSGVCQPRQQAALRPAAANGLGAQSRPVEHRQTDDAVARGAAIAKGRYRRRDPDPLR
jgi:hypothetical protein